MNKDSIIQLHTGNMMPILGLGTWQLTNDTAEAVAHALSLGYRMIDTSSDYGTQPGIREGIKSSRVKREDLYIVTKVEETDDAYERTKSNLKELGIESADLMLIHRPPPTGAGEELWQGLIRAKKEGLASDIGVSNYSVSQIEKLAEASGEIPTVNQIEWSPFGHSEDMLEFCQDKKIVIQAYSPLTRAKRLHDEELMLLAGKYKKTPAQILIRWNLQFGTVPLPKANQKNHLEENVNVFDFSISDADLQKLKDFNETYSSLGSLPYV